MERQITCPACDEHFVIHTVGGMDSDTPMPCDSCAEVLWVTPADKFLAFPYRILLRPPFIFLVPLLEFLGVLGNPYSARYFERLAKILPRCECGGQFRHAAPNHCPKCRAVLPLEEIKRQLNWKGSARPLLYITRYRVHHPHHPRPASNDA